MDREINPETMRVELRKEISASTSELLLGEGDFVLNGNRIIIPQRTLNTDADAVYSLTIKEIENLAGTGLPGDEEITCSFRTYRPEILDTYRLTDLVSRKLHQISQEHFAGLSICVILL